MANLTRILLITFVAMSVTSLSGCGGGIASLTSALTGGGATAAAGVAPPSKISVVTPK
ncbi:MAG TPA: hypothetical protein VK149_05590 [Sideroxyarcus sp.]|nr:hypothetical protein [Sideroxyarcus sp.]